MAFTNFETKEINCKVVYAGPSGAGKSANLRAVLAGTSQDFKAGLMEIGEEPRSTPYFDFLPVSLGHVRDYHIKLHVLTLPERASYDTVPTVLLRGVDGLVFVADSRWESLADNLESLRDVRRVMEDEGITFASLPKVFQYNKRDLDEVLPVEVLRQELNPARETDFEAIAARSVGTMETIQAMAKLILKRIAHKES